VKWHHHAQWRIPVSDFPKIPETIID